MFSKRNHAVIEKAKAMYGKRITKQQYQEMFRCRTVPELASYLKNDTAYREILLGVEETHLHRGQLEHLLHRAGFERYINLYYYLLESKNTLFRFVLLAREMSVLLQMILLLKAKSHQNLITDLPGYLIKHATIDLLGVAKAKNFAQLIEVLADSEYAVILKRFMPTDSNPILDYPGCEYALYQSYYKHLFQMINTSYSGQERTQLQVFFRLQVELANIEHITRSHALEIPDQEVVRSLLPYHYKLSGKQLADMLQAKDLDEIKQFLLQTGYRNMFSDDHSHQDIEGYTKRYFSEYCRKILRFSPFASLVFFAYYNLNQVELNNITTVIEGVRYHASQEQIQELLI